MTDDDSQEHEYKSKTQLKKDMLALQELGEKLTQLSAEKLATIPLDEPLREAILQTSHIVKRGALRRHKQYIGRLMREADSTAILDAYTAIQIEQHRTARQHHLIEKWRDDLIRQPEEYLQQFIVSYPECDRQLLRRLVTNAKKESTEKQPPVQSRKLFKFIRETLS